MPLQAAVIMVASMSITTQPRSCEVERAQAGPVGGAMQQHRIRCPTIPRPPPRL
jgi:hypothetical protein